MSQVSSNTGKNLSIAALVCGILGIVGGFIPVVQYFTTVLGLHSKGGYGGVFYSA